MEKHKRAIKLLLIKLNNLCIESYIFIDFVEELLK